MSFNDNRSYLVILDIVAGPAVETRKERDATLTRVSFVNVYTQNNRLLTSKSQSTSSNVTIPSSDDGKFHRIELRIDIFPSITSANAGNLSI